jgi:hypothetical protein
MFVSPGKTFFRPGICTPGWQYSRSGRQRLAAATKVRRSFPLVRLISGDLPFGEPAALDFVPCWDPSPDNSKDTWTC